MAFVSHEDYNKNSLRHSLKETKQDALPIAVKTLMTRHSASPKNVCFILHAKEETTSFEEILWLQPLDEDRLADRKRLQAQQLSVLLRCRDFIDSYSACFLHFPGRPAFCFKASLFS